MDQVPLKDTQAADSVLSVIELNTIAKAVGQIIPGVSPDAVVILCAVQVAPGLSGAQLSTIKDAMEAISGVQIVRPAVRMIARTEIDMPADTLISLAVEGRFKYTEPVVPTE